MGFRRIEDRRTGDESTRLFATVLYTLLCGVSNCQILNWLGSFTKKIFNLCGGSLNNITFSEGSLNNFHLFSGVSWIIFLKRVFCKLWGPRGVSWIITVYFIFYKNLDHSCRSQCRIPVPGNVLYASICCPAMAINQGGVRSTNFVLLCFDSFLWRGVHCTFVLPFLDIG